ncbi:MAG: ATP-binding protein, partial [Nevskiales bacterium]
QQAALAFETKGPQGLDRYLAELQTQEDVAAVLLDERGRLLSRPPLRDFQLRILLRKPDGPRNRARQQRLAIHSIRTDSHHYEWRALKPRLDSRQWRLLGGARLAIFLSVLALAALLFATWLGRPISRLKSATQGLARGDLSTRVETSLAERRDAIGELGAEFNRMAEHLQTIVSSKERLLRDMSHELRSPLARLDVALEILRDQPANSAALDRIATESQRLAELIDQVMTLARLDDPDAGYQRQTLAFDELVQSVADEMRILPQADIQVDQLQPIALNGHAGLLRSAIENLLRNALHYTADNSQVGLSLSEQQGQACLTIRDAGPGVAESELTAIFRPFYRTAEARDRDSGGYGVGLSIVDRVARLHGGQVTASNRESGGLEIRFCIPALAQGGEQDAPI